MFKDYFLASTKGQAHCRHEDLCQAKLASCSEAGSAPQQPGERKWKQGRMAVPSLFLSSKLDSLI